MPSESLAQSRPTLEEARLLVERGNLIPVYREVLARPERLRRVVREYGLEPPPTP